MRIGSGSTIDAAPASQQPCRAVTRARLVGPRMATWSPGAIPRAWRAAPTARASSWSCAQERKSPSGPATEAPTNRMPVGLAVARSSRLTMGVGVDMWCANPPGTVAITLPAAAVTTEVGPARTDRRREQTLVAEVAARRIVAMASTDDAVDDVVEHGAGRRRGGIPRAPLQRGDGGRHRAPLAGAVGRRAHLRGAQPGRAAGRSRPGRRPAEAVHPRHVPVPVRCGAARRPPPRLHRHRRLRPLPPDEGLQRPARAGLRRVRVAGRAVRHRDRHPPAGPHRGERRQLPAPAAPAGAGPRPAPLHLDDRRVVLPLDAVDLPADLRVLVRPRPGSGPADRRAARGAGRRHPADP